MPRELSPSAHPMPAPQPRSLSSAVLLGAALFVFVKVFPLLSPILLSFLLIIFVSLAVNPLIHRMRSLTGGRKVSTGLMAAVFIIVIGLTGWAFIGPLKASTGKIVARIPAFIERLQSPLINMSAPVVHSPGKSEPKGAPGIQPVVPAAGPRAATPITAEPVPTKPATESRPSLSGLDQMLRGVASEFGSMALNASQIMVVLITVFVGATFTLMNPRPIFSALFSIVPERHHEQTLRIVQRIGKFLPTWAFATLLAMLVVGCLVFLLMWPFFGFVDALVLGLIAGVFEAIPYLGPLLSAVPALFFGLGEGGMTPIWVAVVYLGVQLLENNVISPVIMSRSMRVHPVAVMFSMLLCVETFGVLGVLVAVPMVAIVEILHEELYRKRFLPNVTDAELLRLARSALRDRPPAGK